MDRYAMEGWARAEELLGLLTFEQRSAIFEWARTEGNLDANMFMSPDRRILAILSQTPAKDLQWRDRTPASRFYREWIAARHWALQAASALQVAADLQDLPRPYRQAVRTAAQVAGEHLQPFDLVDALFDEMEQLDR